MAIQDALEFFQLVRRDEHLRGKLEALGPDVTLDDLAQLAEAVGFTVTSEDLQLAHVHDWRMRWARYQASHTLSTASAAARV